jgi:hypothetical protein
MFPQTSDGELGERKVVVCENGRQRIGSEQSSDIVVVEYSIKIGYVYSTAGGQGSETCGAKIATDKILLDKQFVMR